MRIVLAAAVSLAFAGTALALDHAEMPLKTSGCKVLKMEKRDLDGKPLKQKGSLPFRMAVPRDRGHLCLHQI